MLVVLPAKALHARTLPSVHVPSQLRRAVPLQERDLFSTRVVVCGVYKSSDASKFLGFYREPGGIVHKCLQGLDREQSDTESMLCRDLACSRSQRL